MVKLTTKLLKESSILARDAARMSSKLTKAFEGRYGVTYSDCDCEWLIDDLDYGQGNGSITLKDADRLMTEAGYPPLKSTTNKEI